ncbi:MAG: hypothetical protein AVDCRST_MAG22-3822 [uncultured Rubrobacteraceae bacterium]|uniref:Uncharacterized protein n=1 Tax=uncultured Rubrobacteraceae bacterium TaxID=349277 RepID=A0A6J4Q9Y1_9ACTN|nr:MAG: hypothetical protein AVDCRST_MAG22-3822 [uncultured Rubrobacteraceae bacterium]
MSGAGWRILFRVVAWDRGEESLMLWYIRRVLCKEPFDGLLPRKNLGVGCFSVLAGLFGIFLRGPVFLLGPIILAQGLAFVCWRVSDLPPSGRRSIVLAPRAAFLFFQSVVFVLVFAIPLQGLGS